MSFSAEFHERAKKLIARYPEGQSRSALLPLLYLVQSEQGYVTELGVAECARLLDLTKAEVMAVSTFYTMFKRRPQGEWLISVCTQPSCALAGGKQILERIEEELDLSSGPAGGKVSIEEVECLCACDGAPVFSVNYENYEKMSVDDAVALAKNLSGGGSPPAAARGDVPAPFGDVNRRMSGLDGPTPRARGART